jgi:hypothetical protein
MDMARTQQVDVLAAIVCRWRRYSHPAGRQRQSWGVLAGGGFGHVLDQAHADGAVGADGFKRASAAASPLMASCSSLPV